MNVFNHIGISLRLKKAIEKSMQVKLSTFGFIWGNVKPDLTARHRKIPHFKKDADLFFRGQVKKIINSRLYENEKCPVDFSMQLGTITHYLSDFFCHAHTERFKGGFLKHNLYEIWLNIYFAMKSGRCIDEQKNTEVIFYSASSICNRIDKMQHKYLNARYDCQPGLDLSFLYRACMMLCFSIITSCMVGVETISIPQLSLY